MRRKSVVIAVVAVSVAISVSNSTVASQQPSNRGPGGARGTQIQPGESCPPGTTEIRPRNCLGPEAPAPSILDYRPRSTLVTPAHMVKTAKFPAIDFHGHPAGLLGSAEGLTTLVSALDSLNVRLMVVADNMSGERLQRALTVLNAIAQDEGSRAHPRGHRLPQRRTGVGGEGGRAARGRRRRGRRRRR